MKLGVIADIHGNEVALRAVLGDAARCHVDQWWVLGDLVLFGPRPAEVLELLRDLLHDFLLARAAHAQPAKPLPNVLFPIRHFPGAPRARPHG